VPETGASVLLLLRFSELARVSRHENAPARCSPVDLEGDAGSGSFDRDADGMSSENEAQEKRGEGDRGHGEL
jgi:hypothetical protein